MGSSSSTLSENDTEKAPTEKTPTEKTPTEWSGIWNTTMYAFVHGNVRLLTNKTLRELQNEKIKAIINYAPFSIYRPGAIEEVEFDANVERSADNRTMMLHMVGEIGMQRITYSATINDIDSKTIMGIYFSINPRDEGTFEVNLV